MSIRETAAALKRVPLFENCSGRELRDIAGRGEEHTYAEGQTIVRQGKVGDEFFVVLDGKADVHRRGRKLRTLKSGDHFGELALLHSLFSRRPRAATVTAATELRCFTLSVSQFKNVLYQGDVAVKLLYSVAAMFPED
ncbi:MAG TPA: cyclic nucleotide-binding domain-containing protein [Actinomycetota bacterium]|nr:cyclic nucleotide-binding domain-containing protein [Actinomycetota bacterium]